MEILYFNGLTNGETRFREQVAFGYLENHGLHVTHHHINWRSDETFHTLFTDALDMAKYKLNRARKLAIVGVSAGGSMAINVFQMLQDREDLLAINLCGRLRDGGQKAKPSLADAAHFGRQRISQSFIDSVIHCEQAAIPNLKSKSKDRIAVVKQLSDFVVPRSTMGIQGVTEHFVPAFGHGMGIMMGALQLPDIIEHHLQEV